MGKAVVGLNKPNETGNFLPSDGNWKMTRLPMKASTVMVEGAAISTEIVSNVTTGNNTLSGTENAAGKDFVGILAEPIIATDADYATAGKLKGVRVPTTIEAEAYCTVEGTFTKVDVGATCEIGSGSITVDADTLGKGATLTEFSSSTRGKCKFNLPKTETA